MKLCLAQIAACFWFIPIGAAAAGHDWMTSINGSLPLSQLTLPGTHDSGARVEPWPGTAKCQDLSISEQLNVGVRFLDIRCRHESNRFTIYHGSVSQNLTFETVVSDTHHFLATNPGETVIMSIKEEHTPSNNSRSFEDTFAAYVAQNPGKWRLAANIPTLDEARGKIVLFRRFNAANTPKGIDASHFPDNTTFSVGPYDASARPLHRQQSVNSPARVVGMIDFGNFGGIPTRFVTYQPNNSGNHRTQLVPKTNGRFELRFLHSNLFWNIAGASTSDGAIVEQSSESAQVSREFQLERIVQKTPTTQVLHPRQDIDPQTGTVTISWPARTGYRYQPQVSTKLGTALIATSNSLMTLSDALGNDRRFYQITESFAD